MSTINCAVRAPRDYILKSFGSFKKFTNSLKGKIQMYASKDGFNKQILYFYRPNKSLRCVQSHHEFRNLVLNEQTPDVFV